LAKQINELLKQYQETQRELRLSPDNVRKVVEVGLALAEQPCPGSHPAPSGKPVFTLPALKHSWAACAEGWNIPTPKTFADHLRSRRQPMAEMTWCWST